MWVRHDTGGGVRLVLAEGAHLGSVEIKERLRPLGRPFAGPLERLTTSEGEPAAFQVTRGPAGLRCRGAVFGDDSYTLIEATTAHADRFAFFEHATRSFTHFTSLGLGHARRRRFAYPPPPGWDGLARGLEAVWMPPGYPAVDVRLTVHPAEPLPALVQDAILARLELATGETVRLGEARRVPRGLAWCGTLGDRHVDLVVLGDECFAYPFELSCAPSRVELAHAALESVVGGSAPVPAAQARPQTDDAALHWAS